MLDKPYFKSILLGLLLILVIGLALFFKSQMDPDSEPIDFKEGNHPLTASDSAISDEKSFVGPDEDVPQEMVNDMLDGLKETDRVRFQIFLDISQSGRDNDPRIDSQLKNLSPEFKNQLKKYYDSLAPEKRNERGFMAFLIAREIKAVDDLRFLQDVLSEEPCLSMQDCKSVSDRDAHTAAVDETSLIYPQLASLYYIEKGLSAGSIDLSQAAIKNEMRSTLDRAAQHPSAQIRQKAEELQKKFNL